jgi:hypothetical protein
MQIHLLLDHLHVLIASASLYHVQATMLETAPHIHLGCYTSAHYHELHEEWLEEATTFTRKKKEQFI